MPRPIEAVIHADALAANLAVARRAGAGAKVWAVVKADAYGHGIERVHAALAGAGADGFALLDLTEAERLREIGWRGPVLLLEGCFDGRDLDTCSRLHLWHVVHSEPQIDRLAAHKTERPHRVFLKVNSGMNRLGFAPAAARAAYLRLDALPQVAEISLMTHFANGDASPGGSDGPDAVAAALAAFTTATAELAGERSLANSAATLRFAAADAEVRGDWIRPGILLYGSSPDHPQHRAAHWGLAPAMSLRSRVIATQTLAPGQAIGYGGIYTATRPMRIGVVACGYADGYPRSAPGDNEHGTPVLIDGVPTRSVGRVSMDMITVDLEPVPAAAIGSEATLWGRATAGAILPIDEVAAAAGTVGYELMCALARRVPVRLDDAAAAAPQRPAR